MSSAIKLATAQMHGMEVCRIKHEYLKYRADISYYIAQKRPTELCL